MIEVMKYFYLLTVSFLLLGCLREEKNMEENQSLVFDNSGNWELKFDSLNTIQKFFNQGQNLIKVYRDSCQSNPSKRTYDFSTCVYPFTQIDDVKISFAQVRNNSSSIYYGERSIGLRLPYNQQFKSPPNYYGLTKSFFDTLKLNETNTWYPDGYNYSGHKGPYINIVVYGDSINEIGAVIKEISWGYLDALENRSQKLFKKEINELEDWERDSLIAGYEFELRLSMIPKNRH